MKTALIVIGVLTVVSTVLVFVARSLWRKNRRLSDELRSANVVIARREHAIEALQMVMRRRKQQHAEVNRQTAEREATPDEELVDRANELFPGGGA